MAPMRMRVDEVGLPLTEAVIMAAAVASSAANPDAEWISEILVPKMVCLKSGSAHDLQYVLGGSEVDFEFLGCRTVLSFRQTMSSMKTMG